MYASNTTDTYLICATPRSGSTLLCGLLSSTGVAGRPESYFRIQDEPSWASRWRIQRDADGRFDYREYVQAAVAEGSTGNGLFAARVMWGTLGQLIDRLPGRDIAESDLALLARHFGRIRFLHLWRDDTLAQAVSWVRAEQTQFWQHGDRAQGGDRRRDDAGPPTRVPHFDAEAISGCVRTIREHNAAWRSWFSSVNVRPYEVTYEEIVADMSGVTHGILEHLGLGAVGVEASPRHERQGDDINLEWIREYRALAEQTKST